MSTEATGIAKYGHLLAAAFRLAGYLKLLKLLAIILLPLVAVSCRSQYKQPEGMLWEREGGILNPF